MEIKLIARLLTRLCFFTLILVVSVSTASQGDEIIEAQKELKKMRDEEKIKRETERILLKDTKDAIYMGDEEYQNACSLCHGLDAKGSGVYAFMLKERVADLTQIKKRNNGVFPFSKLYRIIDGREEITSHGTRSMPIWGDRYNSEHWINLSPRYSETQVRGRIFELLLYIETLQE